MVNVVAFQASFLLFVFSRNLHAVPRYPSTGIPIKQYDKNRPSVESVRNEKNANSGSCSE